MQISYIFTNKRYFYKNIFFLRKYKSRRNVLIIYSPSNHKPQYQLFALINEEYITRDQKYIDCCCQRLLWKPFSKTVKCCREKKFCEIVTMIKRIEIYVSALLKMVTFHQHKLKFCFYFTDIWNMFRKYRAWNSSSVNSKLWFIHYFMY